MNNEDNWLELALVVRTLSDRIEELIRMNRRQDELIEALQRNTVMYRDALVEAQRALRAWQEEYEPEEVEVIHEELDDQ